MKHSWKYYARAWTIAGPALVLAAVEFIGFLANEIGWRVESWAHQKLDDLAGWMPKWTR